MSERPCVIVTGSSGLIGSRVCDRLARWFHVVGFDRPGMPHPPPSADNVPADLTSDESVRQAFAHVRAEYGRRLISCVHLAAYYDFSGEPSDLYERVTVQGTRRLLEGLRQFDAEQFVFSSTMLVHAPSPGPGHPINEDCPLKGEWAYPQSKIRTEQLIRERRGDMKAVMLRIAGVYDDTGHSIPLVHQMQRIRERWLTSRVFPGDISHGQSFVHLDDVVDAIERTVQRRAQLPEEVAMLIGEPETLGYDELQRRFGRLILGEEIGTTQIPKGVAKVGAWVQDKAPFVEEPFIKPWMIDLADDHFELDISRARRLLGWEPRHSLRDTLPQMVTAMQADPEAWYREHDLKPAEQQEEHAVAR
jgi:nucleoside-diphosphate-sugar epimerase